MSSESDSVQDILADRLQDAEQETSEPFKPFVPISAQREILNPKAVSHYLCQVRPRRTPEDVARYTDLICRTSISLFAILLGIEQADQIYELLDYGLTDEDLPLKRKFLDDKQKKWTLVHRDFREIRPMKSWPQKRSTAFGQEQYKMKAPILKLYEPLDALDEGTILPFMPVDQGPEPDEVDRGGYSEVFKRRIHPAHHDFWEGERSDDCRNFVAIKRLNSSDTEEFRKETDILQKLGAKNHQHLVQLLTTFTLRKQPHLVFPWANSNLRKYWSNNPNPEFELRTVIWSVKQITGLAHGLSLIHDFNTTFALSDRIDYRNNNTRLEVHNDEKMFGRHGDIKPENFLWFMDEEGGVLQLADFGMGRFHGRDSRSMVSSTNAQATPTYEPPECQLRIKVSRKYDIWSMGCVLLEFITWIILGNEATYEFADERGGKANNNNPNIDDDKFYEVRPNPRGPQRGPQQNAIVTNGVVLWVQRLRSGAKCSQLMHDLLDMVMKRMLCIDQADRMTARQFHDRMRTIFDHAQRDPAYVLTPVRRIEQVNGVRNPSLSLGPSNTF